MAWKNIEDQVTYHQKRYRENKELYKLRAKEHRQKKIDFVNNYKVEKGCSVCGEKHIACLDFHHVESSGKVENIANMAYNKAKMSKIIEEIKKCVVLCANCHRKHHYNERNAVEIFSG